jgi:hypothetical protein
MSEMTQRSIDTARDIAKSKGLVAFFPYDDELFLDYDGTTEADVEFLLAPVAKVLEENGVSIFGRLTTVSQSGEGIHVYLQVNQPIDIFERLIVQACMGSDPVKEVLSYLRMLVGNCHRTAACALFETPDMALLVQDWRASKKNILEDVVSSANEFADWELPQ